MNLNGGLQIIINIHENNAIGYIKYSNVNLHAVDGSVDEIPIICNKLYSLIKNIHLYGMWM